jgi:integrase
MIKRCGAHRISFHGLRHTHISHLLADGIDIKTVSERAGHSSASITLDVYSHVLEKTQELAAQKVDAAMRAVLED